MIISLENVRIVFFLGYKEKKRKADIYFKNFKKQKKPRNERRQ